MINVLRAENRKMLSARMTWILLAATVLLSLIYVLSYSLIAGKDLGSGMMLPSLESELAVLLVYSGIGMGAYVIAIVLGVISSTAELRYRTATLTYLATPSRSRVLAAKFIISLIWGAGFALIDLVVCVPVSMAIINSGPHWQIPTDMLLDISLGTVVGFSLYAALGVGLGALMRNQIGAIVGTLTWVFVVEAIFMALMPEQGKWMPGGAMAALAQSRSLQGQEFLSPQQGGYLLLIYAVVVGLVAALTSVRRDVT